MTKFRISQFYYLLQTNGSKHQWLLKTSQYYVLPMPLWGSLAKIFFQFLNYFIVVQLQWSAFSSHLSTLPQPNSSPSPASTLPLGFFHVSFIVFLENPSPHYPFPPPFWLLLDCSLLQYLWWYFVCFFLLLIMFQLKVRSYGICLSLPGLFHLAKHSPVPSMLPQRVWAPSLSLLHRIPLCKCTIDFGSTRLMMGT